MQQLLDFIAKKVQSLPEKALAHSQAQKLVYELEAEFWYDVPYSDFTSTEIISVGTKITRDYSRWNDKKFMTVFPLHMKKAEDGDEVSGTVIENWTGKHECGGLYLYFNAKES